MRLGLFGRSLGRIGHETQSLGMRHFLGRPACTIDLWAKNLPNPFALRPRAGYGVGVMSNRTTTDLRAALSAPSAFERFAAARRTTAAREELARGIESGALRLQGTDAKGLPTTLGTVARSNSLRLAR